MNKLFSNYNLEGLELKNRFLMAPMTRSRSTQPNDIPNSLMAEYYSQRASAGIIISEATQVSLQGKGYARTPGIYTQEQIDGWKLITDSVHKAGSKIFLQLWHVGRVSSTLVNGLQPIGPSELIASNTNVYVIDELSNGEVTFVPVDLPRAMTRNDIENVKYDFVQGAKNAIEAGFDGIEIHGANGYLFDQFLRGNSNIRKDEYGGSKENRIRLLIETSRAVVEAIGKERVGVRLSPFIKFKDMDDPEILDTIMLASEQLDVLGIAYLHLCESDWDDAPKIPDSFRYDLRSKFKNTIVATGNKTPMEGEQLLNNNLVDLVGFGRNFISNPDFPLRVKVNAELNKILNNHTLFGGGTEKGYTDYSYYEGD